MNKEKRIHLGTVGVDSGTLMITDPCYPIGDNWNEKDYDNQVMKLKGWVIAKEFQYSNSRGVKENLVFPTGLGDGAYDVYATIRKLGSFGERITKVEIVMITDEEAAEYEKN